MSTFVIAFLNTKFDEFLMFMLHVYTASKVKHRLNIFYEKTVENLYLLYFLFCLI